VLGSGRVVPAADCVCPKFNGGDVEFVGVGLDHEVRVAGPCLPAFESGDGRLIDAKLGSDVHLSAARGDTGFAADRSDPVEKSAAGHGPDAMRRFRR
jgi:hypothetical protein